MRAPLSYRGDDTAPYVCAPVMSPPDTDDPGAIRSLADYLARLEADLRRRAADLEERQRTWRQVAEIQRGLIDAGDVALYYMTRLGLSERAAVAVVAEDSGLRPETVQANVETARRRLRENRDRLILRLAAAGWRNAEIAERVGCHASTVTRVIARKVGRAPGRAGAGRRSA